MTFGKKTYKRAIATLLTVVMVMAMLPVSVFAAGETAIAHVVKMTAAPNNMVRFELKALSDESLTSGAKPLVTEYAKGEVVAIVFKSTDGAEKYVDYGTTQNNYITSRTTGASAAVAAAAAAATTTPATAFAAGGQVVYPATATGLPDTTAGVTVTGTTPTKAELTGVAITGSTAVGSTLTASLTPPSATATYEWFAVDTMVMTGGTKIAGETKSTLELKAAQKDKFVYVVATPIAATTTGTAKMAVTATKVTDVVTKVAIKTVTVKDASTIDLEFESAVAGLVKGDVMVTKGTETLEVDTITAGTGALYSLKLKTAMTTSGEVTVAGTATSDKVTTAAKSGMFTVTPAGAVTVSAVEITGSKAIKATFTGEVKTALASNFTVKEKVSGSTLLVDTVTVAADKMSATVTFHDSFVSGKTYNVAIAGVKDSEDATVATYTKDIEFTRGAPATIVFTSSSLPNSASVDLKAYVAVKDASGNVLDSGFTLSFESDQAVSDGKISTSGLTSVKVKATVTGTTIATALKTFPIEAAKVTEISSVKLQKNGTDIVGFYASGNGYTAANTVITSGTNNIVSVVKDQFGQTITSPTLAYTSNSPSVVSVNASTGVVTPISAGTAMVTVKSTDGTVTKTISIEVKAASKATSLEVDVTTVAVVGDIASPRMPIKLTTKDQYGNKVAVTDIKFVSAPADVASLYDVSVNGAAISTGTTTLAVTGGEKMFYVQGLKTGTATFTFELTAGTEKITKTVTINSSKAGTASGYEVVTNKTNLTIGKTGEYVKIDVYRIDENNVRLALVSPTALAYTLVPATTYIRQNGSNLGVYEAVPTATTAGDTTVTIKEGTINVGSVKISLVKTTNTITSVTVDKSKMLLTKTSELFGLNIDTLLNNLVVTMSDGSTADLATKKLLISNVISSDDKIVKIGGTAAAGFTALAAADPADADNAIITKGTADITLTFDKDAFAAQTFQVEVGDITADVATAFAIGATTRSGIQVGELTIEEGATFILPSSKNLTLTTADNIVVNGTLQNNGIIKPIATTGLILTGPTVASGKKAVLSGTGSFEAAATSSVLTFGGSWEIATGASQIIRASATQAIAADVAAGGKIVNRGTLEVLGSDTGAFAATLALTGATSVFDNYGTLKITGGATVTGTTAATAAMNIGASGASTLTNFGTGVITVTGGGNADADALLDINATHGSLVNSGTITLTKATGDASLAVNKVASATAFVNNGALDIGLGTTLTLPSTAKVTNNGTITNNGAIAVTTGATLAGPTDPSMVGKIDGIGAVTTGPLTIDGNTELVEGAVLSIAGTPTLIIGSGTGAPVDFKINGEISFASAAVTFVSLVAKVTVGSNGDLVAASGSEGSNNKITLPAAFTGTWDSTAKNLTMIADGTGFIVTSFAGNGSAKLHPTEIKFTIASGTAIATGATTGVTFTFATNTVTLAGTLLPNGSDTISTVSGAASNKITVTTNAGAQISGIELHNHA